MKKSGYNAVTDCTQKIFEELRPEDLQENHKEIADVIGFDNLLKIVEHFGGNSVYFPQIYELCRNKIRLEILKQYDGTNIRQLAAAYGISEKTVYTILKTKKQKSEKNK